VSRAEPGLLEAVGRVGGSLIGLLQNRLELASLELDEAREKLVLTLVAALAAALLLAGAVIALSAWIGFALWPLLGHAVLGWIALVYALAGIGLITGLRRWLKRAPPLLGDTLAELKRDAALMHGDGG
jgi:uncharacterized membrane protein YqjE